MSPVLDNSLLSSLSNKLKLFFSPSITPCVHENVEMRQYAGFLVLERVTNNSTNKNPHLTKIPADNIISPHIRIFSHV